MAFFCTNNREYDYDFRAFHINLDDAFSTRTSAKYLSALWYGKKFIVKGKANDFLHASMGCTETPSEWTITKVIYCALAWLTAITTLGLVPYLATKVYIGKADWDGFSFTRSTGMHGRRGEWALIQKNKKVYKYFIINYLNLEAHNKKELTLYCVDINLYNTEHAGYVAKNFRMGPQDSNIIKVGQAQYETSIAIPLHNW
jgi:hypothetical protein